MFIFLPFIQQCVKRRERQLPWMFAPDLKIILHNNDHIKIGYYRAVVVVKIFSHLTGAQQGIVCSFIHSHSTDFSAKIKKG